MVSPSDKIGAEMFTLLYGSIVNTVLKGTRDTHILRALGKSIGNRMADDYFCRSQLSADVNISQLIEDIRSSFFPMYFGYTPTKENNEICLDGFYAFKYFENDSICVEIFCGILEAIYGYVHPNLVCEATNEGYKIVIRDIVEEKSESAE